MIYNISLLLRRVDPQQNTDHEKLGQASPVRATIRLPGIYETPALEKIPLTVKTIHYIKNRSEINLYKVLKTHLQQHKPSIFHRYYEYCTPLPL